VVKDVSDFFAAGGTVEELQALADAAPVFDPGRTDPQTTDSTASAADRPMIQVASIDDILDAPSFTWRLSPLLPEGAFVVVYGMSGSGKSFIVQGMGLSISAGLPWLGRYPLEQGLVVYVCAEGQGGLRQRTAAWMQHAQIDREQLRGRFVAIRQAVNFMAADAVDELCQAIDTATGNVAPAVVMLDTLSRCLIGGNESAAEDMGTFIGNVGRVQARYGCAVVVVHHAGWNETRMRGSSSLKAAADMEFRVEKSGQMLSLICDKSKDAEEPAPMYLRLTGVTLPDGKTSCVIEPQDNARLILSDFENRVLRFTQNNPDGLRHSQYKTEFVPTILSYGTLSTVLRRLVQRQFVLKDGEGKNARYFPAKTSDDGGNDTTVSTG
jgi:hypothetical protein